MSQVSPSDGKGGFAHHAAMAAQASALENEKGYATMATTDLPINVEKEDTPQPFSKNFDQFANSSGFIFDVSLSTAIAADGKTEERAPKPKGPLSPVMLDHTNRYSTVANYIC